LLPKVTKWVCIAALLVGLFLSSSSAYRIMMQMVVFVAGLVVVMQAVRAGKYFWGVGFVTLATVFNPVVPVAIPHKAFLWLDVVCLTAFLFSLAALKDQPIPSITGRTPGSESL
jgi:hypothetical protein